MIKPSISRSPNIFFCRRQPTEKKIKKYRRNARCMKTRFQSVFFVNGSQTIYSVFINRY